MNIQIIVLSETAMPLAKQIKASVGGQVFGLATRCTTADQYFVDAKSHIQNAFKGGQRIIAVMAAGALIRLLAPCLEDKNSEPAVIAVSEDGSSVVPLLGGHHGANTLAQEISKTLDSHAAITTAGDLRFGISLDQPPEGWVLSNPQDAKSVMASILSGEEVRLQGRYINAAKWLMESNLPLDDDGEIVLSVSETAREAMPGELIYHPKRHVIGLGCERGVSAEEVIDLIEATLSETKIALGSIAGFASIDLKADEAALNKAAKHYKLPIRFFDAATLEAQTPMLENPSEVVFSEVGCHGVAEGAALASCLSPIALVVPKRKSKRVTIAIAKAYDIVDMDEIGSARGNLFVVGIGPGNSNWRSPEVTQMIGTATDLVGYSLYLDLVSEISAEKVRHDFDLGREEDRVRHALELAGEGKQVALVCSGDAGIYAMATLVFELLANGGLSPAAQRVGVQVSPGISALQAAAARAGAPLGHDFCTISLSDLLTPWEAIQMRVKAAAEGDFVIAFYNPVSKRRRKQLAYAKDVLLQHRPGDTPVILATNLGREGEAVRIVSLAELMVDDVDMLTVVIVGSSDTTTVATGDGKTWVYTPRGYSAKTGTGIKTFDETAKV
ncbi:MAG: precorrin-3B C(17)-methyltransferase [Pseudomonadota bacterium]